QPGFEIVNVAVLAAKLDEARLEFAFAFVHESDVALAGRKNCGDGNGEAFAQVELEFDIHVHVGTKPEVGVLDVNASTRGAGGVVKEWVNEGDFAIEAFARVGGGCNSDRQALLKEADFVFIELGPDPNDGKVGDFHEAIA